MRLRSPMPTLDGATAWLNGEVRRDDIIGEKPTLIHFWSVSCYLCKEEMKDVNYLLHRYKDNLNIISVHMPRSREDTNLEVVQNIARKFNMKQPIYIDNNLKLTKLFENEYVPGYYLFDHYGLLRHFQSGGGGLRMLETRLNRLISEM